MSKNKGARSLLIQIFGNECMIEKLGIRKIPIEKRKRIKGYKKTQETITYHHIHKREKGGKSTVENGALIKGYNHEWLHSLPEEQQEEINNQIQEYKINFISMLRDGTTIDKGSIDISQIDFDDPSKYIAIETTDCAKEEWEAMKQANINKNKRKQQRKAKRRMKQKDYLTKYYQEGDELEDDWEK